PEEPRAGHSRRAASLGADHQGQGANPRKNAPFAGGRDGLEATARDLVELPALIKEGQVFWLDCLPESHTHARFAERSLATPRLRVDRLKPTGPLQVPKCALVVARRRVYQHILLDLTQCERLAVQRLGEFIGQRVVV